VRKTRTKCIKRCHFSSLSSLKEKMKMNDESNISSYTSFKFHDLSNSLLNSFHLVDSEKSISDERITKFVDE